MVEYIRFICPTCGKRRKAELSDLGKTAWCSCGCRLVVPANNLASVTLAPEKSMADPLSVPSEQDPEVQGHVALSDFWLPGCLVLMVATLFLIVWAVHSFLRADQKQQIIASIIACSILLISILTFVICKLRDCKWFVGLGYAIAVAICIYIVLSIGLLVGLLITMYYRVILGAIATIVVLIVFAFIDQSGAEEDRESTNRLPRRCGLCKRRPATGNGLCSWCFGAGCYAYRHHHPKH
jgi:hypothetical protein